LPTRTYLYAEPEHTAGTGQDYALTGIIDENGTRLATYDYDASGLAIGTQYAGGADRYAIAYNLNSDQTIGSATITDPVGTQRTYRFTSAAGARALQGIDQPGGAGCVAASNARTYDADGNIKTRTAFNGVVTTFVYDTVRNLETSRTVASGTPEALTTTTSWHATFSLPLAIVEPKRKTTFTYDAAGNLLTKTVQATTDANGAQGLNASVTGVPRKWTYTYNARGQVSSVTGPRTDVVEKTVYSYDAATGNLLTVTDPAGHVTTLSNYDSDGRVGRIVEPNGLTTVLNYSPRGWLLSRQVGSETTRYDYDAAGQVKTVTLPDGASIHYTYDEAHRLTDVTDSLGNRIHYTLDPLGHRTREEVQDPAGKLSLQVNRQYDALNRLQQVSGGAQ
jgi:YD repeat-containing protein